MKHNYNHGDLSTKDSVEALSDIFAKLQLPLPQVGEYFAASGSRRLVFINDLGIVVRMTPTHKVMTKENPHFIKSLFQYKTTDFQYDIDPGLECPVPVKDAAYIYKMLNRGYGLEVLDSKPDNLAYLPQNSPRFPIVLDLEPYYTRINPFAACMTGRMSKQEVTDIRTALFW